MFKLLIALTLLTLSTVDLTRGQCARCEALKGTSSGSVRTVVSESQPSYEPTVTRYESSQSQPVYYPSSVRTEERYYPSEQVVYTSHRRPQYQTEYYESQPQVVTHRRVVSAEPYPYSSQSQGTRYYTQSQPSEVVYRQYSPCAGSSGGISRCA